MVLIWRKRLAHHFLNSVPILSNPSPKNIESDVNNIIANEGSILQLALSLRLNSQANWQKTIEFIEFKPTLQMTFYFRAVSFVCTLLLTRSKLFPRCC